MASDGIWSGLIHHLKLVSTIWARAQWWLRASTAHVLFRLSAINATLSSSWTCSIDTKPREKGCVRVGVRVCVCVFLTHVALPLLFCTTMEWRCFCVHLPQEGTETIAAAATWRLSLPGWYLLIKSKISNFGEIVNTRGIDRPQVFFFLSAKQSWLAKVEDFCSYKTD